MALRSSSLSRHLSFLIGDVSRDGIQIDNLRRLVSSRNLSALTEAPAKVEKQEPSTTIQIKLRSFERPWLGLPSHTSKIGLPDSRKLFTVLRSPHIDKKSREQFEMRIKKTLLVVETRADELKKKYFWLKRQRILGAQYEILFNCKTRLDKEKVKSLLSSG